MSDDIEELKLTMDYSWELTGHGSTHADETGEPNAVISEWEIVFRDFNNKLIGAVTFSVVNQGEACNLGENLTEVYDSEDDFHMDYFEHVMASEEKDDLLLSTRVVLVKEEEIQAFSEIHQLNVLNILERIFADTVVAVWCEDRDGNTTSKLSTVLHKLPKLPNDDPREVWLYHDSKYVWSLRKPPEERAS